MKTLYLLILLFVFGNCITTTSYYPEGIEKKQNGEVANNKSAKPKVKLSVNGNFSGLLISIVRLPIHPYKSFNVFEQTFQNDSSSPVYVKVNLSTDRPEWSLLAGYLLPWVISASSTYSIQYGNQSQIENRKFEIIKKVYLPIPILSMMANLFFGGEGDSDYKKYNETEQRFVLSLREEIAKIAPLADPDSETPQTTDLPTTFNDIVVLKNGDILEGVHTKVTPTTLEVTESNGKKTIYKKSQVLSVKKK